MDADKDATGRSRFLRYATRRRGFLVASLLVGFVVGVAYRAFLDEADSRSVANYLRSGFDGLCIAWAAWAVQTGFASGDRLRLGAAVRRLPLAAELLIRALVMTAAIVAVSTVLEAVLYAGSLN
ncbi:MAG: hypothetical protein WBA40_23725, partial [Roseiarcus sp.]